MSSSSSSDDNQYKESLKEKYKHNFPDDIEEYIHRPTMGCVGAAVFYGCDIELFVSDIIKIVNRRYECRATSSFCHHLNSKAKRFRKRAQKLFKYDMDSMEGFRLVNKAHTLETEAENILTEIEILRENGEYQEEEGNGFLISKFIINIIIDLKPLRMYEFIRKIIIRSIDNPIDYIFYVLDIRKYIRDFDQIFSVVYRDAIDLCLQTERCDFLDMLLDIPDVLTKKCREYQGISIKSTQIVEKVLSKNPEVFNQYRNFTITCDDCNIINHLMIYGFASKIDINTISNFDNLGIFLMTFPIQEFCVVNSWFFVPSKAILFLEAQNMSLSESIVERILSRYVSARYGRTVGKLAEEAPALIRLIEGTMFSIERKDELINILLSALPLDGP